MAMSPWDHTKVAKHNTSASHTQTSIACPFQPAQIKKLTSSSSPTYFLLAGTASCSPASSRERASQSSALALWA